MLRILSLKSFGMEVNYTDWMLAAGEPIYGVAKELRLMERKLGQVHTQWKWKGGWLCSRKKKSRVFESLKGRRDDVQL